MNFFKGIGRGLRIGATALLAAALASVGVSSHAQRPSAFPERQVRLIVGYPPGGGVDITSRMLARELTELWGQPVVVENRTGASGQIAGDMVAKAPGDGHTLLLTDDGSLISVPFFQEKMSYDPLTDLVPVAMAGMFPYILVANSSFNVKTLPELVAAARARPGAIDYATNGIGGTHHLAWERFQRAAGIRLNHIPYKGAAPALQDVLAGRVPVVFVAVSTALPYIKDGRLVSLATGGLERLAFMPELPTVAESGYPGFEVITWMAVLAPKGTPPVLVEKISSDINKVTLGKAYGESMAARRNESRTSTPRELAERIRADHEQTRAQIKNLGIKTN